MKDFPFDAYDFFGYLATGLLILVGLEHIVGVPEITGKELKTLDLLVVALGAYIVGQITATPAKALLEDFLVGKLLKKPSTNLMREKRPWMWFAFPGYLSALPAPVRGRVLARASSEGESAVDGEALFLHIRFRDYVRTDAVLIGRLDSFLNKYGFNRNLCFACLAVGLAILCTTTFDVSSQTSRYALLSVVAGVALFYRYLKFFRQYSYELFNAYAGRSK